MILILSVFTGMLFILVKTINMMLSHEVGIYKSNVTNHLTGTFGALLFVLLFATGSTFEIMDLTNVGVFPLVGGILGATFVALSNYTLSKTKVLISTLLILVGQTLCALTIDYLLLDKVISFQAIIGTILIIVAVILYSTPVVAKS